MITNSSCTVRFYDYCNLFTKLLTVISAFVLLLLLTSPNIYSQCTNYCGSGSFTWNVTQSSSFCFAVPYDSTATICMEFNLTYQQVGGCNPNETVTLGIFNGAGQRVDSVCTSPFNYTFTANVPPNPKNCPNGQGVHCCAAFCPEDLYIRILDSNGNDYSQCYTGTVKCCITCYQKYQGGPCTQ